LLLLLPPLEKGANDREAGVGDSLLLLLASKEHKQKQIPPNPPFTKGELLRGVRALRR
jgi:hypothetical protein